VAPWVGSDTHAQYLGSVSVRRQSLGTTSGFIQGSLRLICLMMLCGLPMMQQASVGDGLSFDPFPFDEDCLAASEVDIGGCQVGDALMVSQVGADGSPGGVRLRPPLRADASWRSSLTSSEGISIKEPIDESTRSLAPSAIPEVGHYSEG
jgi:hypothetical protein